MLSELRGQIPAFEIPMVYICTVSVLLGDLEPRVIERAMLSTTALAITIELAALRVENRISDSESARTTLQTISMCAETWSLEMRMCSQ